MNSNKWILGFITVLILSSIIYITFKEDLRIRVDNDKTTFYVKDGRWLVAGREYNKLFDGTRRMNRISNSIEVEYSINESIDQATITRYTKYIRGPVTMDTYYFEGNITDVELFPIKHTIEIYNATGFFYRYEVRDLYYDGESGSLSSTEMKFGKKMKVEWEPDYRWARVYKSGILKVQYDIDSDYVIFENKLFDPDSYLLLDGVADNRTYEYETTANISTDYQYITIHDNTSRYINYSINSTLNYTLYLIDLLRYAIADFSHTDGNITTLILDDRNEVYSALVNITSASNSNASITAGNETVSFPGTLYGPELHQTEFLYSNRQYLSRNISFESAEIKTIYINYSAEGSGNRTGRFNLTINAYELDADNTFAKNETMENLNISDATYEGTITNGTAPFSNADYSYITETFLNNDTFADRWDVSSYYSADLSFSNDCVWGASCVRARCADDSTCDAESGSYVMSLDYWQIENISHFTLQSSGTGADGGKAYLVFTDGSTESSVIASAVSTSGSCGFGSGCSAGVNMNMTFKRINEDYWNVTSLCEESSVGGGIPTCPDGDGTTIDVSALNPPYNLKWYFKKAACDFIHGQCTASASFARFGIKGPQLNKTNSTFSGLEGGGTSLTGNFSTSLLETTTTNVTRVLLSADALIPDGTTITFYLSNDNGTTYEEITLNEAHLFSSVGNQIRAKFHLTSNSNISTPIVTRWYLETTSSVLSGLSVDVGSDGLIDGDYLYELNSTSTPIYWESNDSSFNKYIFGNCEGDEYCLIPISFISDSAGVIGLDNINLTENINPVNFTVTQFSDDVNITTNMPAGSTDAGGFIFYDTCEGVNGQSISNPQYGADYIETTGYVYSNSHTFSGLSSCYGADNGDEITADLRSTFVGASQNFSCKWAGYPTGVSSVFVSGNRTADSFYFIGLGGHFQYHNGTYYNNITLSPPTNEWWEMGISRIVTGGQSNCSYYASQYDGGGGDNVTNVACKGLAVSDEINFKTYTDGDMYYDNMRCWNGTIGEEPDIELVYPINYEAWGVDYRGSRNITVVAHDAAMSSSISYVLNIVYSPFSLFFPSGQDYWQIFPSKRNQSNIQPYGQNTSTGIWNLNTTAYDEQVDIYVKLNESINSCVTLIEFRGQNYTANSLSNISSLNISNLNTSGQKIIQGLTNSTDANIWTYTQINCSQNTDDFYIPYFCFYSICEDCVQTYDWEDSCDIYE